MSHPDDLIAVLDANVLYPQWLRDVMLSLAAMGYYEPRWSNQIIEEMRRNVLANHTAASTLNGSTTPPSPRCMSRSLTPGPTRRTHSSPPWTTRPMIGTCSPPPSLRKRTSS